MRKHGYVAHLALTAVVGLVFWVIGEFLIFEGLANFSVLGILARNLRAGFLPVFIAVYFALFGGAMYGVMFLLCKARNDYSGWEKKNLLTVVKTNYKHAALALVAVVVASGLFQFLYQLDFHTIGSTNASSYIFVIDDSGSMSGTDPQMARVDAISEIMAEEDDDMPYAVYRFTHETERVKDMGTYKSTDTFVFEPTGGTDIVGALNMVIADIESGDLEAGKAPKVLLLSDGSSDSYGVEDAIKGCLDNNIVVSTISYTFDSPLLRQIAEGTGGTYNMVADASLLKDEMQTAVTSSNNRNLLSDRYMLNNNVLYGIIRVVMLVLLGLGWSWMKQKAYCCAYDHSFEDKVFLVSAILTTVSAVLTELLFLISVVPIFGDPAPVIRLIFCVCWAITPGVFYSGAFNIQDGNSGYTNQGTYGNYDKCSF